MKKKIHIGIAGYGHLGSLFVAWLKRNSPDVHVLYIVEPDRKKLTKMSCRYKSISYKTILHVPTSLISKTDVVVDCSTIGQGFKNKIIYRKLNLKAVFQNGESIDLADLYYPGIQKSYQYNNYLRVPCCSAMSVLRIILTLQNNIVSNPLEIVGYHFKTSNDSKMMTMNYKSGKEISLLTGIKSTMNRIYLRGRPHMGQYVYAGNIEIKFDSECNTSKIVGCLSSGDDLRVINDDSDTLSMSRTTDTLIIKESINYKDKTLRLAFLSMPPEIDFPANIAAIRYLYSKRQPRSVFVGSEMR